MTKRILVIDDEASIRLVIRRSLNKLRVGYEVETASSGEEAMEKMAAKEFDLIITDLRLPDVDGLELIERIQAIRPRTRLILITAFGSDRVEAKARQLDLYRYITKPFVLDELLDVVRQALRDMISSKKDTLVLSEEKRVLIIEDSLTQAAHLQTLLEQEGLKVICAYDGKRGLQIAQQVCPDIIVLDFYMPGMDGLQVCEKLKMARDTADIPVIMFTSRDVPQTIVLSMQLGVVEYIPKDAFADAVLLQTLRRMDIV